MDQHLRYKINAPHIVHEIFEDKEAAIIKEELAELRKKYADPRRTEIAGRAEDIEIEDMIADEDMAITISNKGYIKRLAIDGYRSQKRGGKGVTAMTTGAVLSGPFTNSIAWIMAVRLG